LEKLGFKWILKNSERDIKKMIEITIGELFCGPGGLALGGHWATQTSKKFKVQSIWAVDNHRDTCDTYLKNIKGINQENVFCEDIRQFNFKKLKKISEKIDGFSFGFPCNDFSLVGEQKGINGSYGPLYSYGLQVIKNFEPDFFIAENVGGLLSANNGLAIKIILEKMEKLGYEVTPHLYKFEKYGVPQTRHRLIIVGFKKSLNKKFKPPAPTHIGHYVTAKEALENEPIKTTLNHKITELSEKVRRRLEHIKPGQNAWTANIPPDLQLNVKGAKLSQIYKKLDPNKPAYTITGSGGGGTHVYHWKDNRALTNREKARLQTFPDNFEFIGSKESVRRQIGMAVPPLAAKVIFEAVINTKFDIPYNSIEQNITI
jgi:DNA (cytosine-5)-methyltransferase 1